MLFNSFPFVVLFLATFIVYYIPAFRKIQVKPAMAIVEIAVIAGLYSLMNPKNLKKNLKICEMLKVQKTQFTQYLILTLSNNLTSF